MPQAGLLEVRNLCVDLAGRAVLSDISFAVPPGAIVGICGESGGGKSTLALALLRLLPSPPYRARLAIACALVPEQQSTSRW